MQFRIISIFFIAILNNLIGQIPFTENERKQGYKEIDGSVYFLFDESIYAVNPDRVIV